jgi:hypothetical protein
MGEQQLGEKVRELVKRDDGRKNMMRDEMG